MIQFRTDGSFVKTNQLRISDSGPPFNSKKLSIAQGFNHYQVTPGRQIANREVNLVRKPTNKTDQITKLKKKNTKTAKHEIHRRYHSNLYEEINERDRQCKEKIRGYAENRNKKMKKNGPRKTCAGGGSGHTKLCPSPARQAREGAYKENFGKQRQKSGNQDLKHKAEEHQETGCNLCEHLEDYYNLYKLRKAEKRISESYNSQQQNRSVNYGNRRNVKKTIEEAYKTDSNTDTSDYEEDEDYFEQTIST
ncbi:Hypothetical predicted protein [Mytilus galloprovincialis]|uniref:Uncharacterized protein n=1 Tax=Mytilus galloprovincialis TaxID=29158 RepID=A0A8B6GDT1_MYTGA|nr:Hypothetical predicted protein [Mytilus galloprovincialis]